MKIKLLRSCVVSAGKNGKKGDIISETKDISKKNLKALVAMGLAEEVGASVKPTNTEGTGAFDPETASDADIAKYVKNGKPSRDQLDAIAEMLEIEDAEKFPNKDAVAEAILENLNV